MYVHLVSEEGSKWGSPSCFEQIVYPVKSPTLKGVIYILSKRFEDQEFPFKMELWQHCKKKIFLPLAIQCV